MTLPRFHGLRASLGKGDLVIAALFIDQTLRAIEEAVTVAAQIAAD
jgi:hypothetical protein